MNMGPMRWGYPGARWWKFDFHNHTPASTDYGKGADHARLRAITPKDWLLGYMRTEVDCVVVTDHNSAEWIDRLQIALKTLEAEANPDFRPMHLFPGVEITANGGVHVLAILDCDKSAGDVSKLLGAVAYRGDPGASDVAADCSPIQVVEAIAKCNGIAVLAHVDGPAGAFADINGNTLLPLLESESLFAIEVCDPIAPKPEAYRRRKLAWAEVLGSDSHHPAGGVGQHFPGSHFTWVKMGSPSIEGLRLALLDGNGVSIRRSDAGMVGFDPFATPDHFIERIAIKDARYMGRGNPECLVFSPWFNALVGGRGTGKSTIAHFIRIAYRREHELDNLGDIEGVASAFKRFNHVPKTRDDHGGLTGDEHPTIVQLVLMRNGQRYRLNWRQNGAGPVVEEHRDSGWVASESQSVAPERFPVRLFSQGQIAGLATGGSHALFGLIDQAVGSSVEQASIREHERQYLALRASSRELSGRLAGRDALNLQVADVKRKLDRFEQAHHAEVLKEYQKRTRQEREIERQINLADAVAGKIRMLAEEVRPDDVPDGVFDVQSAPDSAAVNLLNQLSGAVRVAAEELLRVARNLSDASRAMRSAFPGTPWHAELVQRKRAYTDLIAALRAQGVADPSEYGKLVQERQRLEGEIAKLDSIVKQRDQIDAQSKDALAGLAKARRALSEKRAVFLEGALGNNPYVRIALEPYGRDARGIDRSFRELIGVTDGRFEKDILIYENNEPVGGIVAGLLKDLSKDRGVASAEYGARLASLKDTLAESCEGGLARVSFRGHFANFLEGAFKRGPEFLDHLMVWYPEDSLQIGFSPKGDGKDFRSIDQASDGQRAAAMLAFLLAHGNEPIVLDQPEDDLDNHLIYELVVQQIRAGKQRRQIIAITHNPNVVVNGDAEMIHAFDFRGGQCRVLEKGCLQEEPMREEICKVMEGGRDAFERRYRRLGRE